MTCKDLEFRLDHKFISYDELTLVSCHNLDLCVLIKNGEPFNVTIKDSPTLYMKIFNYFQDKFNHMKYPPMFLKFGHMFNGMFSGSINFKKTRFGKTYATKYGNDPIRYFVEWVSPGSHQRRTTYSDASNMSDGEDESLLMETTFTNEDMEYFSFFDWLLAHHANYNYDSDTDAAGMSDVEYMIRKWKPVEIDEIESYTRKQKSKEIKKFLNNLAAIPATYVDISQFKDCSNIPVYKDGARICDVYTDDSAWKICNKIANTLNNTNGGNNNMKIEKKETIKESVISVSAGSQENIDRYVADLKDLELGEAFRIVDDKNQKNGNWYLIYVVVSVEKENVKDKVAVLSLDTAKVTFMDPKTRVWVYKKHQCKYVTGSFWMEHEVEARF